MALQIEGKKIYDKESETTSGVKTKQRNRLLRNITLNYINTAITNLNMQSAVWVLYLAYCGLNLAQIGFVEGIYHATSIVFEIPSGVVADLLGRKRSMILSKIWHVFFSIVMILLFPFVGMLVEQYGLTAVLVADGVLLIVLMQGGK